MRPSFCSDHRVDADGHLSVLTRMQGARFEVYKVTYGKGYRTEDVTIGYDREVPVYGDVRSTVTDHYGNSATITTRGVTGTRTVTDRIKVGERQVEYTTSKRTPIAFTDDLDEAVKAYRSLQCYTDENKHFVVHYHDYVKETNL